MLLWMVRKERFVLITLTITDLILNARKEMLAAQSVGDTDSAKLWAEAVDRFLDAYADERRADADI